MRPVDGSDWWSWAAVSFSRFVGLGERSKQPLLQGYPQAVASAPLTLAAAACGEPVYTARALVVRLPESDRGLRRLTLAQNRREDRLTHGNVVIDDPPFRSASAIANPGALSTFVSFTSPPNLCGN